MKKISKVELENFRIFSNKKEINFNNAGGKPADLVCVYGKNGLGKTSLFDGFEWFFTGKIHLLEKDLQTNVSQYSGNILRNKYTPERERASVTIKFSDGTQGRRTVVKKSNSQNDYGKGKPSGQYKISVTEKQILPHNKIDGFVYATKPTQMFEEWGNFWDPDHTQREIFNALYKVNKEFRREEEEVRESVDEINRKIQELDVDKKIKKYNQAVEKFNEVAIKNIEEIDYLQYPDSGQIDLKNIQTSEAVIQKLTEYQYECHYLEKGCRYIEENFEKYNQVQKRQNFVSYKKEKWNEIANKCKEKKEKLDEKGRLLQQLMNLIDCRNSLNLDQKWFLEYQNYNDIVTQYKALDQNIHETQLKINRIQDEINQLEEFREKYAGQSKLLDSKLCEWKAELCKLNEEAKEQDPSGRDECYKLIDEAIVKNKKLEQELRYLKQATVGDYSHFVSTLQENEIGLYGWIKEFDDSLKKASDLVAQCQQEETKSRNQYEQVKADLDNLDELVTLARDIILKNNTHVCPVCKSSFASMQELLDKQDFSVQQELLSLEKERWEKSKNLLREAEQKKNDESQNIKKKLENRYNTVQQENVKCRESIKEWEKYLVELEEHKLEQERKKADLIYRIAVVTGVQPDELTESQVQSIYEQKKENYKLQVDKLTKQINEKQDTIIQLGILTQNDTKTLYNLEKKKNAFMDDKLHLEKIEQMNRFHFTTYEEYLSFVDKNYNSPILTLKSEIREKDRELIGYKIYRPKDKKCYRGFLSKFEKREATKEDWIFKFNEYKVNIFKNKAITPRIVSRRKIYFKAQADLAKKKLEFFDQIDNSELKLAIKDYNSFEEDKKALQEKLEICKFKSKFSNDKVISAQQQLEEYIKTVFGGNTIGKIYEKLEPHKRFKRLQYRIAFNDDGKPELYVKVLNEPGDLVSPELFFSSAQLNIVALSVFLGGALSAVDPDLKTIFIDDPVGHFDDLNVLSFIDILRTIISETDWQIIISTHEENFYEILKVKLDPEYYNSKFFVFEDEGTIVEDPKLH